MSSSERQAYDTHFHYITCLSELTTGVTLTCSHTLRKAILPDIDIKDNLIRLTKQSLNDEAKIVRIDNDYSYASTCWLPVKSYYLIFNVLLILEYVLKIQKNIFRMGHTACMDEFTRKLKVGELSFSETILNEVFDSSILAYVTTSGANLSNRTGKEVMYKLAIRKIARYKFEAWKEKEKINPRIKTHKMKCEHYLSTFEVSIFDFIYYMRIRSNYRDFAFIDNVNSSETTAYFVAYFLFTLNIVRAVELLKRKLIVARS
jgi:hypothetical protein